MMFDEYAPVYVHPKNSPWCPYNGGIICPEKDKCKSCAWNPEVDAARRPKTRERVLKDEQ